MSWNIEGQASRLCKTLIENILGVKINSLEYVDREKTLGTRIDTKGIRLDVYVEDSSTNRVFDVEMQISSSGDLPKRTRYYQSLIDQDHLHLRSV